MRVIAGTARRLPLKTLDGLDTRPTTDRIKETLFNMIQADVSGSRFLDLFSGSGSIGIEALSRGASECVFVEKNRKAAACIRENLSVTRLEEHAVLMECDVLTALRKLEDAGNEAFDIIYMDPPYGKDLERETLTCLSHSRLVDEVTLILVEASLDTDFSYLEDTIFTIVREKKYKTNKHVFISMKEL
ncbi:16S rRNA (guanine(966)-N(2))-methyltransferase RsmD [Qiania dongpingensis]|uniref:16S rRNA (Guanine(966)-N(2))-methyltransferase RsmD n=1 Tax=Qiania dongpingensis TaxID=2763669 RepID=A0A7G9G4J7_9FIRM|nr:16S rRNA (guanine(966)-N(2))-methyltransferase RsmD [Qiania dongpingensis]QNM05729.1 16S rRNA (guanine(966)-N(2))-methyltransferase RsmD [Qiania dongpingensis]